MDISDFKPNPGIFLRDLVDLAQNENVRTEISIDSDVVEIF